MIHLNQGSPEEIVGRLPEDWAVVDIGGWAKPLHRANFVVDCQPYETRRNQDVHEEHFTKDTWSQIDFGGSREYKLPFGDQSVDFVWCQQTLEDIANPFFLISEIQRISNAGFIEVPNREWESTVGVDSPNFAGFCHHRWFVEVIGDELVFTMKSPFVTQYGECELPEKRNLGFIWSDSFLAREQLLLTKDEIIQDLIDFKNIRRHKQVGVY